MEEGGAYLTLRLQLMRTCDRWVLIHALIFNSVLTLWTIFPYDEDEEETVFPSLQTIWEILMVMCSLGSLSCCVLFGVLDLNISAVHPSNIKAFFLAIEEAHIAVEMIGFFTVNGLVASVVFLGFLRLQSIPHVSSIAVCFYFLLVLSIKFVVEVTMNYVSYVAIRSGVMESGKVSKLNLHAARGQALKFEENETMAKVISNTLHPKNAEVARKASGLDIFVSAEAGNANVRAMAAE
mmetsp:Transcript_26502/g.42592  ORF Transcript_26502/g.42592 Transcript_26502/m.42592 type:complete len:237 (+) Transcript_26502:652-1362(+)